MQSVNPKRQLNFWVYSLPLTNSQPNIAKPFAQTNQPTADQLSKEGSRQPCSQSISKDKSIFECKPSHVTAILSTEEDWVVSILDNDWKPSISADKSTEIRSMWPEMFAFLKPYLTPHYVWSGLIGFPDKGKKPPISVVFGTPTGQNWVQAASNEIISEVWWAFRD